MPPKKPADKPSKKTEMKKKEKTIEDKTFGMKNKKGNKQQKYIAQVEKQVKSGGDPRARKVEEERALEKKKKEEAKRLEEEKKALFRPVMTQKVENGVDPKSVFCAFFKQGLCKKGDKCKFSHDPDIERKSAKRSIYTDTSKENDNMDDWDDDKLAEVVGKKHAAEKSNETDIICKYFLDAVENSKYGWFWTCPEVERNPGKPCKYRHALPPGFVLKKDKKKEEKTEKTSIEELIEQKRSELSAQNKSLTPVNLQTFVAWKKRKLREKADAEKKAQDDKKKKMKSGLTVGMSGRDMFLFDPKMISNEDDDEEGGEAVDLAKMSKDNAEENPEEDNVKVHEIKFDEYGIMDDGLDASTNEQLNALGDTGAGAGANAIDEDLFDDEDLDELEEDLNNLDV